MTCHKGRMMNLHVLMLMALVAAHVARAGAGEAFGGLGDGDLFVATVTRVEDEGATQGKPPLVWLKVHEMLCGKEGAVRSPAVWQAHYHDIDWGDENTPELKRWQATPMKGPDVGKKFILAGKLLEEGQVVSGRGRYLLLPNFRTPFSEEARIEQIKWLKEREERLHSALEEQARSKKELEARTSAWRAAADDSTIDKLTIKADSVAVALVKGGTYFEIERMLKGRPRMSSDGVYYVSVPKDGIDPRIDEIIGYERRRCVVFFSEANLVASVTKAHADLVDPYLGIVLADEAAIGAVQASLAKHPAPKPRPVLVVSALDRKDALPLLVAGRKFFEVVEFQQFSTHWPERASSHVRETIPDARYLVMIGRGPERGVQAVKIEKTGHTLLHEGVWTEKEMEAGTEKLLKILGGDAGG
jgi:hypothetical protein